MTREATATRGRQEQEQEQEQDQEQEQEQEREQEQEQVLAQERSWTLLDSEKICSRKSQKQPT